MTDDHDLYREWAAAYVLGSLDPTERVEYERHIRICECCQSDVNDFAAFPGLLAQAIADVEPSSDSAIERITQLAVTRADHDHAHVRASARRWRLATVASVAAALILLVTIALDSGADPKPGTELAFASTEAIGSITVVERPWGTSIELDLQGLPQRDTYQLWAIDEAGAWTIAATWQSTPEGLAKLTGAAAVPTRALDRVVITSPDRDDVLVDAGL